MLDGGITDPIGSTISLYLAEGRPSGVRIVEKDNWSGIGVECSRKDLPRARKAEAKAFQQSGVYLLLGDQDDVGLPSIYIGEADVLEKRLANHATNKDFWTRAAIFTGKDGMINRAHAKHLEARLFQIGVKAKRAQLENKVPPGEPNLSNQDRDLAERFLREMLVVLPVIGVSAFELPDPEAAPSVSSVLKLQGGSVAEGKGIETAQGFKVFAQSRARLDEVDKIQPWIHELRADLIANGVLEEKDGALVLTQDYLFKSPSAAAAALLGRSANGREFWRASSGKMLKEIQDAALTSIDG